jgi:hypothetical protein
VQIHLQLGAYGSAVKNSGKLIAIADRCKDREAAQGEPQKSKTHRACFTGALMNEFSTSGGTASRRSQRCSELVRQRNVEGVDADQAEYFCSDKLFSQG